jgi:hypothetical protein
VKIIEIPSQASEVNALLEQARHEDLLLRSADGQEFMLTVITDSDWETARTRQKEKLMESLDERTKPTAKLPLEEVRRQLGL